MDHIRSIWMILEGRRHGVSNVKKKIDTHGDPFPKQNKWKMHTDKKKGLYANLEIL